MSRDDILILRAGEVAGALAGREEAVLDIVRRAYEAHEQGESSLPHSTFLRFPDSDKDRIIALPAYLGGGFGVAGIKWIASVPANVGRGLERASALVVLNARETGRPEAILEGSIISKQRTAASAALAARVLRRGRRPAAVGLVGCGPINREVLRFLAVVWPGLGEVLVFDLDRTRAEAFGDGVRADLPAAKVRIVDDLATVLAAAPLTSFATTAVNPHVDDLSPCPAGATLLHVSLRDLTAAAILGHHNVVDDLDHVCRAGTSIHLAAEQEGHRDFVHASLGEILLGRRELPPEDGRITIFSPFGLGILDLAVARLVESVAREQGSGTVIESFLP